MDELLYHYTGQDGLLGIIENKNIWASNIHYLNDSKEFIHTIERIEDLISNKKKIKENEPFFRFYDSLLARVKSRAHLAYFIVSLTAEGDLLSQWRGYCSIWSGL